MDFALDTTTTDYQDRLLEFMDAPRLSRRAGLRRAGAPSVPTRGRRRRSCEELKAEARKRGLWNLFLAARAVRRRADEPAVRAARRDHGPVADDRSGGPQLRRARHRQHGDPRACSARQEQQAALAGAAARRRDPLGVLHDRAGRRLLRRHQHRSCASSATATSTSSTAASGGPRARSARDCKILIVMGVTDPDGRAVPAAVACPRARGHAGRHGRARRCRSSATTTARTAATPRCGFDGRARAGRQHPAGRGRRVPDRPGAPRARAASTTACARSAWPSARWS